jgi:S-adenosylmethionine synthetase
VKPGNLRTQGAKSCGFNRKIRCLTPGVKTASGILSFKQRRKNMEKHLFTSESVTGGHPDKICDQIADAVLDAILAQDKFGRVACEVCCTTGMVMVIGEISTSCYVDIPKVAREVICSIGYDSAEKGFDGNSCAILTSIDEQSKDIALGVDKSFEMKKGEEDSYNLNGAGDQGMMFGFACDETPELMPMPISLAHSLARRLTDVRKNGTLPYLRPDGKTQVTVEYDENDRPLRVDTIVVSSQHSEQADIEQIRKDIIRCVVLPVIPENLMDENTHIYVNPTGRFVTGGPQGDSGVTGRKIIVDTYGGYSRHGGGAFSGKDPTKVDRSAAYAARYVAKNIVAARLASKCEVQLAYVIGVAKPVSVMIDTFGTGKVSDEKLSTIVNKLFDLRPAAIIDYFDLRRPIYRQVAALGHMGRTDIDLPWEHTDMVEGLKKAVEGKSYGLD